MRKTSFITAVTVFFVLSVQSACSQSTPAPNMSFFITSAGPGNGADLGGISGADAHCQSLAAAVGAGNRTWRAYLSTVGQEGVNARDRIGSGPWFNFDGVQWENLNGTQPDLTGLDLGKSWHRHPFLPFFEEGRSLAWQTWHFLTGIRSR